MSLVEIPIQVANFCAPTWDALNEAYRAWREAHPRARILKSSGAVFDNHCGAPDTDNWSMYVRYIEPSEEVDK